MTPTPVVDVSNFGIWDAGNGFYGVGGELILPSSANGMPKADTEIALPACKVVSWQGNVSIRSSGEAEVLCLLKMDGALYLPQIIKCAGEAGKELVIAFLGLDWPCPAGKLVLHVESLSDKQIDWEMQSILKTVPA